MPTSLYNYVPESINLFVQAQNAELLFVTWYLWEWNSLWKSTPITARAAHASNPNVGVTTNTEFDITPTLKSYGVQVAKMVPASQELVNYTVEMFIQHYICLLCTWSVKYLKIIFCLSVFCFLHVFIWASKYCCNT